jgi:hypothetical protein
MTLEAGLQQLKYEYSVMSTVCEYSAVHAVLHLQQAVYEYSEYSV